MKEFRKQQFNPSLDSNTQENIKEADTDNLIPLCPVSPSCGTSTSCWQAIGTLCFETDADTGYNRIEEEKEQRRHQEEE
jgi:hypothetical protein